MTQTTSSQRLSAPGRRWRHGGHSLGAAVPLYDSSAAVGYNGVGYRRRSRSPANTRPEFSGLVIRIGEMVQVMARVHRRMTTRANVTPMRQGLFRGPRSALLLIDDPGRGDGDAAVIFVDLDTAAGDQGHQR